jgi:hypothetical protein
VYAVSDKDAKVKIRKEFFAKHAKTRQIADFVGVICLCNLLLFNQEDNRG